jgi:hypothetical protein
MKEKVRSKSRERTLNVNGDQRSGFASMKIGFETPSTPVRKKSLTLPLDSFSMLKGLSKSDLGPISPHAVVGRPEDHENPERSNDQTKAESQGQIEFPPWSVDFILTSV